MQLESKIYKTPEKPLDYKAKMDFQMYLMKRDLGESPEQEGALAWIDGNAETISGILDDNRNAEIRKLVMSGDFEKASELFSKMAGDRSRQAAA